MTWKEFKDRIEALGVSDESEIQFMDLYPDEGVNIHWEEYPKPEQRKPDTVVRREFYVLSH